MFKDGLVLTLGHGSSAILIIDNKIVNGYQTERITRVKGDSRFPSFAIEEIQKFDTIPEGITIYISHWEPSGKVCKLAHKHYDPKYLSQRFPTSKVVSTGGELTHHDTHAFSALAYYDMPEDAHICVADGFGTWGEVMSFYQRTPTGLTLVKRVFGYNQSLGLLYQYATDYVGLRQNRDEWKLNAMAIACPGNKVSSIEDIGWSAAQNLIHNQQENLAGKADDPVLNLGALSHTHAKVVADLNAHFEPSQRAEVALYLQTIVEEVMRYWVNALDISDLTVVGGCFLNVQLNGFIQGLVKRFCAMPLSGDEGAGLGLFKRYNPDFSIPDDLCFGKRNLTGKTNSQGLVCIDEKDEEAFVRGALKAGRIVNIVRGGMEFGPRAYCNTSTLALPTEANRCYINNVNNRSSVMPMCPVLTDLDFKRMFQHDTEITRSVEHMIVALPLRPMEVNSTNEGVTHTLLNGVITGRPQVISEDHWLYSICKELGPLINTSFNTHGEPICYDLKSVQKCHDSVAHLDVDGRIITFVVNRSDSPPDSKKQARRPT